MEDDVRAAEESVEFVNEVAEMAATAMGRPRGGGRARNYMVTIWQDFTTIDQIIATKTLPHLQRTVRGDRRTYKIRFLTGQFETSPETHRVHFQGYIQFEDKVTGISLCQEIFGPCHVEVARGTVEQCIGYCTKEETRLRGPYTFGTPMQQGQRNDLLGFKRAIQEGARDHDLWTGDFTGLMLRHYKTVPILRRHITTPSPPRYSMASFCVPPLEWDGKTCWVIAGQTGIGKTAYAEAHFERPYIVRHLDKLLEFDTSIFDGIVFDDLDWRNSSFTDILNVIDFERECQLNVRYSVAVIPPGVKRIFCTNREDLFESYKLSPEQLNAVKRRIQIYKPVILFSSN